MAARARKVLGNMGKLAKERRKEIPRQEEQFIISLQIFENSTIQYSAVPLLFVPKYPNSCIITRVFPTNARR